MALLLCLVQAAGIAVFGQEDVPRAALKRAHQAVDSIAPGGVVQAADSLGPQATDFVRLPVGEGRRIPPLDTLRMDSLRLPLNTAILATDSIATADSIADDNIVSLVQCSVLYKHGSNRSSSPVKLRLDNKSLRSPVGICFKLLNLSNKQYALKQVLNTHAGMRNHNGND